jgi:lipopolysaccharide export system protein LptC
LRTDAQKYEARLRRARAQAQLAGTARKLVLGLTAAVAIGFAGYLFWPRGGEPLPEAALPETPSQAAARKTEMSGADGKQMPYTIRAEKTVEDKADRQLLHLETVDSVFARPEGKSYKVTSKTAEYDRGNKKLELNGSVNISDAPRMVAKMEKAFVDTETRSLVSGSPVEVTLENGFVTADQLTADNNGERLIFKGRVKARFNTAP